MRYATWKRLVVVPVVVLSNACGGETDPELNDLTQGEAALVLAALSAVWFPSPSTPTPGPFLAPETTVSHDTTDVVVACPAGGSAAIFSIDTSTVTIDSRLNPSPDTLLAVSGDFAGSSSTTASYDDCQSSDGQGNTWSFDASPGLDFGFDYNGTLDSYSLTSGTSVVSTILNWSGQWSGSFDWSNGSRSGSCTIALSITSATMNSTGQASNTVTQNGQICGLDVSNSS